MRCKYCKQKIDFGDWISYARQCYHCSVVSSVREDNKSRQISDAYWRKQ